MARKPHASRRPSKAGIKAAAERAEARSKGEPIPEPPKKPLDPPLIITAAEFKAARGRPTKFTPLMAARICEDVADAIPLQKICAAGDMPDTSTVYRWLRKHDDFRIDYARARRARADARMDRIDEIVDKVELGVIDPQVARVMIDAIKWQMSKEQPGSYGDKVAHEHTGADGGPIQVEDKMGLARWIAFELAAADGAVAEGPTDMDSVH